MTLRSLAVVFALGVPAFASAAPARSSVADVEVDGSRVIGEIRPLHGVNLGPLCYRGMVDLSAYHRELQVPLTRLHDVVWMNADAVDISTLFRDFRNDPDRAESYDFATTDDYIQAIVNVGSRIVYRLGESIEHTPRKYRVHPPSDPGKWAAICVGVIRHYNDGWAHGFHHNIRHWEIWNEPDVRPAMWTGTDEQYFQLYEVTAKAIKARFPDVKVGGPALGGTGDFAGETFKPTAFLTNFLARCRQRGAPLDFFSWHRYTSNPWDLPRRARAMRLVLDKFGFANTESHLNEWNYLPHDDWKPMMREGQGELREKWYAEMGGPAGAAFTASGLILLQDAPVDAANYYTGEIQGFGLFDFHGVPKKTFYAMKAFRGLLDTPLRLAAQGGQPDRLAICAGTNPDRSAVGILISSFQSGDTTVELRLKGLPWRGPTVCETCVVDALQNLAKAGEVKLAADGIRISQELKGASVCLLKLKRADDSK